MKAMTAMTDLKNLRSSPFFSVLNTLTPMTDMTDIYKRKDRNAEKTNEKSQSSAKRTWAGSLFSEFCGHPVIAVIFRESLKKPDDRILFNSVTFAITPTTNQPLS